MSSGTSCSVVAKYTAEPSGAAPAKVAALELPLPSFAAGTGTTNQLSAASAVATGIAGSAIRTSSSPLSSGQFLRQAAGRREGGVVAPPAPAGGGVGPR